MKKLLLSAIACMALAPAASAAPTVDELVAWGGYAIELPYGGVDRGGLALWSSPTIKITKKSNTSFTISGIFNGMFGDGVSLEVTNYNSSTGKFTIADESRMNLANGSFGCYIYGLNSGYTYYSSQYGYYYDYSDSSMSGTVTKRTDTLIDISIPACELANSTYNIQLNGLHFYVYDANAVATDTFNGEAREYNLGYYEDGSTVSIRNLGNSGMQYYCNVSRKSASNNGFYQTEGTIDAAGNITLNQQYAFSTGCINIEKQKYTYSGSVDPWYEGYDNVQTWMIKGATNGNFNTAKSTISGKKYDTGEVGHAFNKANRWVSNGGNVKTYRKGTYIELDDFAYYTGSTHDDECVNTVITLKEGEEITHSADFVKGELNTDYEYTYYQDLKGVWHKKLILNGTITNRVNNDLVASYDLFIVPKPLADVTTWPAAEHDNEKGHYQAVCIASGLTPAVSRSNDGDIPVKVSLTGDAVPALNIRGNNAMFLRANYTDPNLHPTFHSLVNDPITTSIETVEEIGANDIEITAGAGEISVSGAANVEIYTISGAQVYAGGEGTVAVAAGIYVVKADGAVRKVTVK